MQPDPRQAPTPTNNDWSPQFRATEDAVRLHGGWVQRLRDAIGQAVVGQETLVDRLLVALLADGHVLLEGVPGLAKTLSLKSLAAALHGQFQRLQFTPDMLPSDIVGTLVYRPETGSFETRQGPVFANFVLADEINRAPAKVQAALLEAMGERQVTIGDTTHPLPTPFLVLATQNPLEQEGTYALPEAQLDRFLMKVRVGYPTPAEELRILERNARTRPKPSIDSVVSLDEILGAREVVDAVYLDGRVKDYIVSLVAASRRPEGAAAELSDVLAAGISPRGTIGLALAAKAHAFLRGRAYVTPQDVQAVAPDVLRHRLVLRYEASLSGWDEERAVQALIAAVPSP